MEGSINGNYLRKKGIKYSYSYVVPKYNYSNYKDAKIIKKIKLFNPDFVIINIGGGIQEPLANYLYLNLKNHKKNINILYWCCNRFFNRKTGTYK